MYVIRLITFNMVFVVKEIQFKKHTIYFIMDRLLHEILLNLELTKLPC